MSTPSCDIPGALYLGPLPSRAVLRREGNPHKAPEGYGLLEEGRHVFAVPDDAWCPHCEGDGCKFCKWTGLRK